jgi:phage anti-repressor protein
MTQINFDFQLAQSIYTTDNQFPVDFDDAWQWLGYSRKDSAKRHFDKCNFIQDVDFSQFHISVELDQGGNTYRIEIRLTLECFKLWAMMTSSLVGNEVRQYFLECERIAKDKLAQVVTKEIDAVEKVKQFSTAIDLIFSGVNIEPELISGLKLNTAKKYMPIIAPELEESRLLLINSTATEHKLITVTELGKLLTPSKSAVMTNQLLISKGYQIKNVNKKSKKDLTYLPTDKAKDHCSITLATGSCKADTYQQLRWYNSIADLLR